MFDVFLNNLSGTSITQIYVHSYIHINVHELLIYKAL